MPVNPSMDDTADVAALENVQPGRLTSLLEDAGWRTVGGRSGVYARLEPGDTAEVGGGPSVVIPLNARAPDYLQDLRFALRQLSSDRYLWTRFIYPRLIVDATDQFWFRKEMDAPGGLIPWRKGERLYESARRALLAGAKFFVGPDRHFVNRHSGFASRYLDQVLMGQTAPGSFIVSAYAPASSTVPRHAGRLQPSAQAAAKWPEAGVPEAPQVRVVNEAVARAMEATSEALEHFRSRGSLAGFEAGVARGVSYEMTNAIIGIAADAQEADVTIDWDESLPLESTPASRFVFRATDVEPLSRAAVQLATDSDSHFANVSGRVHLLAKKQARSPGVFGVESFESTGPRKVRVRLADEEDYHEAVRAHDEDLALQVSGRLEKEGNLSWLYDATVVRTLGHLDEYLSQNVKREVTPGQGNLF